MYVCAHALPSNSFVNNLEMVKLPNHINRDNGIERPQNKTGNQSRIFKDIFPEFQNKYVKFLISFLTI